MPCSSPSILVSGSFLNQLAPNTFPPMSIASITTSGLYTVNLYLQLDTTITTIYASLGLFWNDGLNGGFAGFAPVQLPQMRSIPSQVIYCGAGTDISVQATTTQTNSFIYNIYYEVVQL